MHKQDLHGNVKEFKPQNVTEERSILLHIPLWAHSSSNVPKPRERITLWRHTHHQLHKQLLQYHINTYYTVQAPFHGLNSNTKDLYQDRQLGTWIFDTFGESF